MSAEISPGDVVRLKSGGPKMTVTAVDKTQYSNDLSVWCEWFDDKFKAQSGTFSLVAVQKIPEPGTRKPRVIRASF